MVASHARAAAVSGTHRPLSRRVAAGRETTGGSRLEGSGPLSHCRPRSEVQQAGETSQLGRNLPAQQVAIQAQNVKADQVSRFRRGRSPSVRSGPVQATRGWIDLPSAAGNRTRQCSSPGPDSTPSSSARLSQRRRDVRRSTPGCPRSPATADGTSVPSSGRQRPRSTRCRRVCRSRLDPAYRGASPVRRGPAQFVSTPYHVSERRGAQPVGVVSSSCRLPSHDRAASSAARSDAALPCPTASAARPAQTAPTNNSADRRLGNLKGTVLSSADPHHPDCAALTSRVSSLGRVRGASPERPSRLACRASAAR